MATLFSTLADLITGTADNVLGSLGFASLPNEPESPTGRAGVSDQFEKQERFRIEEIQRRRVRRFKAKREPVRTLQQEKKTARENLRPTGQASPLAVFGIGFAAIYLIALA